VRRAGAQRSTPLAHGLLTLQSVVVSGHKGREVEVDTCPRCPHCGKRLGEYLGLPWSIRCRNCGQQARRD
jgi:tRNA(Ile2) C34 agmatinyltransferase TiaS